MMIRKLPITPLLAVCAGLSFMVTASTCLAWWPGGYGYRTTPAEPPEIVDYIKTGYQANAMWPYPYVCPDRIYARQPFEVMTHNGWRRQNLLGSHHFEDGGMKLTRAGELKVRWVLTQTPPQYRQLYVERASDPEITELRLATAKNFAAGAAVEDTELIVQDTYIMSEGRSAHMVDSENTSYIQSRRPAVLPALTPTANTSSN